MTLDIDQVISTLGLVPVGNVVRWRGPGIVYHCVEIENVLGRVWMVLLTYDFILSGHELMFSSSEISSSSGDPHMLKRLFCCIPSFTGPVDLRERFDECRLDWDQRFLASVLLP